MENLGHILTQTIHVVMCLMGISALYSLKIARQENRRNWDPWVIEVWVIHVLFVFAAVQRSAELFIRAAPPTIAVAFVAAALAWTIHRTFAGKLYRCTETKST